MVTATKPGFSEPGFYIGDPHPTLRKLRAEDPVHWHEPDRYWVVTRYEDIRFISTRPDLFSSTEIAILMNLLARRNGKDRVVADQERSVMFMDPPEHGAHRKAFSHRFTPKAVGEIEGHVRTVIRSVFDGLPDGEFDWIEEVAEPVPVFVFAKILGVPESDWHQIVEWATAIVNVGSGQATDEDMERIYTEVGPYLWALVVERQANPTDDLLTVLTTAEVDGRKFTEPEIITHALTLLAAGSETTQSLIAGMAAGLCAHPDQADQLFASPSLAANTVEETLRWWTPVLSMARQATTDVDVGGTTIAAGDGLLLLYLSANRDELRWEDVDEYRITRTDASAHLGFGFGEHFCVGAHLARREGRIVLEELAARYSAMESAGEPTPRQSALVHTFDRFPIRLIR